jgi:hypothetical protein
MNPNHEIGMAMIYGFALPSMDSGLLDAYGFSRPKNNEPWHIEVASA